MEEFWAYEFLSLKNVRPAVVQSMQDDKIDCEAVVVMTDDHLKRYLPAYGDRVALMAFARVTSRNQNLNLATSAMPPRREGAGPLRGRHILGNKRAARVSRRVELGWFNKDRITQLYKQVRLVNGGGARHLSVPKSYTLQECKATALLFFPDDRRTFGRPTEFSMSIRDFKGDMLEQHLTVEDVYQHQHTKTLRLSLYTSHKAFTPESTTSAAPLTPSHASATSSSSATSADPLAQSHASATLSSTTTTAEENNVTAGSLIATASSISNVPATSHASGTLSSSITTSAEERNVAFEYRTVTHAENITAIASSSTTTTAEENNVTAGSLIATASSIRKRRPADAAVNHAEESRPQSMIDIVDSEDEEIARAIDASLRDMQEPIRLVFQELCSSSYFEGGEEYKIFAHNFEGLEREEYGLVENLEDLDQFQVDHGDWVADQGSACSKMKLQDTADVARGLCCIL
ncbi:uncharacterized protein LOC127869722 [Dreissena polymorpha]|uniref:uncharacterized protein LOC127869722 n=1 Tax=Dreissena polymorpha TaxID=45954 RepID=UPI002263E422|nr:uncharacterized protein LOC127869722 [Dreissena polymorpha]